MLPTRKSHCLLWCLLAQLIRGRKGGQLPLLRRVRAIPSCGDREGAHGLQPGPVPDGPRGGREAGKGEKAKKDTMRRNPPRASPGITEQRRQMCTLCSCLCTFKPYPISSCTIYFLFLFNTFCCFVSSTFLSVKWKNKPSASAMSSLEPSSLCHGHHEWCWTPQKRPGPFTARSCTPGRWGRSRFSARKLALMSEYCWNFARWMGRSICHSCPKLWQMHQWRCCNLREASPKMGPKSSYFPSALQGWPGQLLELRVLVQAASLWNCFDWGLDPSRQRLSHSSIPTTTAGQWVGPA